MAGLTRKVHIQSAFDWGSIDKFAPDLGIRQNADGGGGQPVAPPALCFRDPDGESHVFLFNEDGRKALIAALSGGVVVAGGMPWQCECAVPIGNGGETIRKVHAADVVRCADCGASRV